MATMVVGKYLAADGLQQRPCACQAQRRGPKSSRAQFPASRWLLHDHVDSLALLLPQPGPAVLSTSTKQHASDLLRFPNGHSSPWQRCPVAALSHRWHRGGANDTICGGAGPSLLPIDVTVLPLRVAVVLFVPAWFFL